MTGMLPLNTSPLPVRLTLDDYLLLGGAGAFADYTKTELIEGEILYMNAQHRPHARIKSRLHLVLARGLEAHPGLEAIVEASIALTPHSAPEPDIVVTDDAEGDGLVPLSSVRLQIEVSDTTLAFDRQRKLALYAAAAVPEYWIVDVEGRALRQHWQPEGDGYAEQRTIAFGDPMVAATITGLTIVTTTL